MTRAVPLLGYVYVALAVPAFVVGPNHPHWATALFTLASFAYLWFLGSLRAKIIRYDPDGFFASLVVLGGGSLIALQAAALAGASYQLAAPAAACAATVIVASSLAALRARKVSKLFGRLGLAGGAAVLGVGVIEGGRGWTFHDSTVWASSLGFMVWVLATATYLWRRT
ncbi:MAG TPA: hypothetical protein VG652_00540 [Gaiellaceae bacterium]|nr:hypothetical protein [Gaiellaceae bacterium]